MTNTESQALCNAFTHDWVEEYYGYKCSKCGLFFAYGSAPWEPEVDDDDDNYDFDGDL